MIPLTLLQYDSLLADGCKSAEIDKSTAHQLRHGGPSSDGACESPPASADMQRRLRHGAAQSTMRYLKPGRYLRRLATLTPLQRREAEYAEEALKARLAASIARLPL